MALGGAPCPAASSRVPKLHPCSAPESAPRFTGSPCPCTHTHPARSPSRGATSHSQTGIFQLWGDAPKSWCLPTRGCDAPGPGVCPPAAAAAAESTAPAPPAGLPKRGSRARRCPPRGFIAPLWHRYRGHRSREGRRGLCAGTRSPAGSRPRAGIPVRSSGEADWERARAGGLGKVSAPYHPCLAQG